jgi:PAS domain S-box-containing protein
MSTQSSHAESPEASGADVDRRLRDAEARFAGIVGISADAVISVNERQEITLWNEGAARIFGYAREEILGRPLGMLLPERFRAAHVGHVEEFGRGPDHSRQMGHRREISGLRKTGEEFPCEASISRYREATGALVFNVVLRDTTDRRRSEERLRLLAEAGEILASSLDPEVTVRRAVRVALPTLADACIVNVLDDAALRVAEFAHLEPAMEELMAETRHRHPVDPEGQHPVARVLRTRAALVVPALGETDVPAFDEAFGALWRALGARSAIYAPLVARDRILGVMSLFALHRRHEREDLVLAEDLGRRIGLALDNARLYEAAQRAIRARDETVAVVSHDLRNPVNAITMIAGNLSEGVAEGPGLHEYLQVIRQAAAQADALIQDLLDVTRIEAGRLRIDVAVERLDRVVAGAVEVLEPLARQRSIELTAQLPRDMPDVCVDAARVQQVISNLVGNAIKFTPAGGRIVVRASLDGDEAVVTVTDTGPGISPEHQPHVFDRYWQGNRPTRFGAGLGLPIAKGIVEAHGGRIGVESAPGRGSTFWFTVPLARPEE